MDVCVANSRPVPEESLAPYLAEGAEPLRLDREEIMALGVAVREFPLCSSGRYIRHQPRRAGEGPCSMCGKNFEFTEGENRMSFSSNVKAELCRPTISRRTEALAEA